MPAPRLSPIQRVQVYPTLQHGNREYDVPKNNKKLGKSHNGKDTETSSREIQYDQCPHLEDAIGSA